MCEKENKIEKLNKEYFDEILYVVDEKYVKLNLIVDFEDIFYFSYFLKRLEELSSKYKIILVDINSSGGLINTSTHIISALRKFNIIVTNNCGIAFSSGFNLWACGDFKFTDPSDIFLYHREMWGIVTRSNNHKRKAEINDLRHRLFFEKILFGILTDNEFKLGEESDVYIIGKEMIDRGVAYDSKDLDKFINNLVKLEDGKFIKLNDGCILIKEQDKFLKYNNPEDVWDVTKYLKM